MFRKQKDWIYSKIKKYVLRSFPELQAVNSPGRRLIAYYYDKKKCGQYVKVYPPAHIYDTSIGDYSYIADNSYISDTTIGKCCSIGTNFICGWGIHPTETISTHPMFFSTKRQNGMTLSSEDKIEERKHINIGNDVFIGANVTVLDGVTIGDGAVIGAGAVVSKDIPPYAVAVGCPIKIIRYRFDEETCQKLQEIRWWDFDEEHLQDVEEMIFDVKGFVEKYNNDTLDNNH